MHGHNTIVAKDGWLYLLMSDVMSSEPTLRKFYYPTGIREYDFHRNYGFPLPLPVRHSQSAGGYYYQDRNMCKPLVFTLTHGGNTFSTTVEHESIPCPKVRKGLETRYRDGHWQKLLKTGWVAA